jgi:hypothetical protein
MLGWNPDGVTTEFTINPAPGVDGSNDNFISIMACSSGISVPPNCDVIWTDTISGVLAIICDHPPFNGADLFYQSVHLPTQIVS